MDEICPICNGLDEIKAYCSECKTPMDQIGRVEDNKGPYSPYMDADTFTNNNTVVLTGDNCWLV
ncbi:MAG TPA: hypothetical protein VFD33_01700 [Bacillota bacterium]|nr:hypothetical protein [Bacillota bacterium]